ncbi:MAG: protein of unknown function (DUF1446) [uncultured archaeon A07HR67]|nr:MAG: protein of unknown function (DUF1446) [uncultured archaeon A07HR67]
MTVRIANAAGFWGDYPDATERLLASGAEFDYLQLEYLAEVTMGVLDRLRDRDPEKGYATDFIEYVVANNLAELVDRDVRVVTNAGGLNPASCAARVREHADEQGVDATVATVTGDDLTGRLEALHADHGLEPFDGETPYAAVASDVVTAAAYLGAFPVAAALDTGVDVVITGRVVDPALALGPLIHEYGWDRSNHDRLAAGTVAGHLIECGTQVTGGNSTRRWEAIDYRDVGYPIVAVDSDGEMRLTKPDNTGGEVSRATVAQQLVYEIGDPRAYLTPDVAADFTAPKITEVNDDTVAIAGCAGDAPPDSYKVSVHFENGYRIAGNMLYSRPDALAKAKHAASVIRSRIDDRGLTVRDTRAEFVGHDAAHGPAAPDRDDHNEVLLRFAARGPDRDDLRRLATEFAPLSLAGPPSVTGLTDSGRPRPRPIIDVWPTLVPKSAVEPAVTGDA